APTGCFCCINESLKSWLRQRALENHQGGASRCFVVCDDANVVGYYALAAGSVGLEAAPGAIRRNMPDPIPVAVLGRLAVDRNYAGQGIGSAMLKDAVLRTIRVANDMGTRALLCHAIDDGAKAFYLHHGFLESPTDPLTVLLNISRVGAG
ncbi:MAG TPA: GNAT family N-acetyltransferase, partial [Rudaea sp.]|nr:GNAT family N-acetyltransferase [Rudaea sp.]